MSALILSTFWKKSVDVDLLERHVPEATLDLGITQQKNINIKKKYDDLGANPHPNPKPKPNPNPNWAPQKIVVRGVLPGDQVLWTTGSCNATAGPATSIKTEIYDVNVTAGTTETTAAAVQNTMAAAQNKLMIWAATRN